ncbi:MAG: type II toxin-antitoxin system VapC family toxin [Spirochaetia bacterium]
MIILDTCAVLWLAKGSDRLSSETVSRIDKETVVAVSAISAFEIALKYRNGKLSLPMPPEEWWARFIIHHRVDVIDLSTELVMGATRLPHIHNDPADRFIISTALMHNSPVVSADRRFAEYGIQVLL